jgi:hypothetical protein
MTARGAGLVVLAAAVTAAGAGCGGGDEQQGPQDVTRAYLEAVAKADGAAVCALMTSDFQQVSAQSAGARVRTCAQSVRQMAASGSAAQRGTLAASALKTEDAGREGVAFVRITTGPWQRQLVTLREVGGAWRIAAQASPGG